MRPDLSLERTRGDGHTDASFIATTAVAAPPDAVWAVLSDVAAWPDWLPTVDSVQPLDGIPLNVGSRYVVRQPKLRPATWVVTELEQPRRFVWVARSPGLRMVAEHTVEKGTSGTSRVVLRFSFTGLLGALVGRLFRSVTESYLAQEAASLKQKVEMPTVMPQSRMDSSSYQGTPS